MLVLAKAILALMIGFFTSIIFGLVIIPILRKSKVKQSVSVFLKDKHKEKEGTPTMGGLIFIIPTLLTVFILLMLNKIEFSENLFIILFVFISYAILGFIDDYLIIKRRNNIGLTEIQKLFGQLFIAVIFFYIFMKSGNQPSLDIHTLDIHINMGWFYGIFLLFILVASSNAVNITDGLDGLAGGLSLIAFLAFGLISWNSTWVSGSYDIAVFCFILVGSLLGFLFFNTNPAKVFMGDTGSFVLGTGYAAAVLISDIPYFGVLALGVPIASVVVSLLHRANIIKLPVEPLHHTLNHYGMSERKIVLSYWGVTVLLCVIGILAQLYIF